MHLRFSIRRYRVCSIVFAIGFAAVPSGFGQAAPASHSGDGSEIAAQIPARMQSFVEAKAVAGVVTLVAHGDHIVEFNAAGMGDIDANHAMTKDTIFQIMSMTKPVTSIGIMMLAEEGKLALRDPVETYLPEFKGQRVIANAGADGARMSVPEHPVTIRDLMTHTSGVPDEPPAEIKDYRNAMNVTLDEVVRNVAKQKLLFQPGTAWSYSSAGMEVLGRIIEVVSGEKYEDFIAERILRPLKMKDSFFYPDKQTPDQQKRIAMVYVMQDGKLVPASRSILGGDPTKHRAGSVFPAPGWGLYSTAEDLLHLYEMMLHGGVYEGHRYLSEFAVHLMTEAHTSKIRPVGWSPGSDFGLGWEVVTEPLGELGGHSIGSFGHGGAFGTQGWIDPKNGLISIMLIQKADGRTETMSGAFLTMAEATVER